MSLLQRLAETYDNNKSRIADENEKNPLVPICHTPQKTDIEVFLNEQGDFIRANVVSEGDAIIIIPCTEDSESRTSGVAAHPLCDSLEYIAGDFEKHVGVDTKEKHSAYLELLEAWTNASGNKKLKAILSYIKKDSLVGDLIKIGVVKTDQLKKKRAIVRWIVEITDEVGGAVWKDKELFDSWINYYLPTIKERGLCFVTGEEVAIAKKHPRKIRHLADGCKLISSNDNEDYTFRGRFHTADQACTVGFEVTQKAHSALRWLIARQSLRNDTQVIVVWSSSGKSIPPFVSDSYDLLKELGQEDLENDDDNAAQAFAQRFKIKLQGYSTQLGPTDRILILVLDSIADDNKGRLSMQYYRELTGSELLERIEEWHTLFAWRQEYYKNDKSCRFIGAPSLNDIIEVIYRNQLKGESGKKIRKLLFKRLLSCVVDGTLVSYDLVQLATHKVYNRMGFDKSWQWRKALGIACSLYKAFFKERKYQMALESDRDSRGYLFGRLLAIAERIEQLALYRAEVSRPTNAERLMRSFSGQPMSTWKQICERLIPYRNQLCHSAPGFLVKMNKLIDEISSKFKVGDFNNQPLDGEYLLGYSCQRAELWVKKVEEKEENE